MNSNKPMYTMVARHGGQITDKTKSDKNNIVGYTLISSDYQTKTVSTADVINALKNNSLHITNLGINPKGQIVSTNGAMEKYTLVNAEGQIVGKPCGVILDRVNSGDKLCGYTIFLPNGNIAEVTLKDALTLLDQKMIANGKVRHTQSGDIISSINGNYPLRQITIEKAATTGKIKADIIYFGESVVKDTSANKSEKIRYIGAIISCTSAAMMTQLYDKLSKISAVTLCKATKSIGNSVREQLAMKRIGVNSIYASFDEKELMAMLQSKKDVDFHFMGGKEIMVSSLLYEDKEFVDEGREYITKDWQVTSKVTGDTAESQSNVKKYAKELCSKYSKIRVADKK